MLQQENFNPEQLAAEWSGRIAQRMKEIGVSPQEVEETRNIIVAFTRTAAQELIKEPRITPPYSNEHFDLTPALAHQIIELFLRGVNYIAKKLRDSGKGWDERKEVLENIAFKLFNLAKLLVAFTVIPNPTISNLLNSPKDLQLMMRQSADVLLDEMTTGRKGGGMPFDMGR